MLEEFIKKYHSSYKKVLNKTAEYYPHGELSDCILGEYDGNLEGKVSWQAIQLDQSKSFSNVETALNIELFPSINEFYGSFYSAPMFFYSAWGEGELLQAWNHDDFERLQQNIIGHLMMKQKLKQPLTWFIGVMDEEQMITVNNDDGSVWLEVAGEVPTQKLSDSIESFISSLEPKVIEAEMPTNETQVNVEHPGLIASFKRMWRNLVSYR